MSPLHAACLVRAMSQSLCQGIHAVSKQSCLLHNSQHSRWNTPAVSTPLSQAHTHSSLQASFPRASAQLCRMMQSGACAQGMAREVEIPRSVPGLVTPRLLVMNFVPGTQIMRLKGRLQSLSAWQRDKAKQRILSRITAAYGHMLLVDGLFQALACPACIHACLLLKCVL